MPGELTLRVITPDRIVVDEAASAVRIPAIDGLMGILPRHAAMVAVLDSGVLTYTAAGGEQTMFVSGGLAEVRDNTVRLVTQTGEKSGEIDEQRARASEQRARKRIEQARAVGGASEIDLIRVQASLRRAIMRIRARGRLG